MSELINKWNELREMLMVPMNLHDLSEKDIEEYSLNMDWSYDYTRRFLKQMHAVDKELRGVIK